MYNPENNIVGRFRSKYMIFVMYQIVCLIFLTHEFT